jgi:hypothetical protein
MGISGQLHFPANLFSLTGRRYPSDKMCSPRVGEDEVVKTKISSLLEIL